MRKTIVFAVSLGLASCSQAPSVLPSGTYKYTSTEGSTTLKSAVTVSREAGSVLVRELASFSTGTPIVIETRLDPVTYSITAFSVTNDTSEDQPLIEIRPGEITYLPQSGKSVVVDAPVPGAPAWIFAEWMSTYMAIPAMMHAAGAKTLNVYYPTIFHVRGKTLAQTMTTVPVSMAHPVGVPASDVSLGLAWRNTQKPAISVWYDPATYVTDAVYLGDSLAFSRER
jgi:hypothetical protein